MERQDRGRTDVDGNPEVADQDRMNMQPGRLEDVENASAHTNRTDAEDTTSLRPRRGEDRAGGRNP